MNSENGSEEDPPESAISDCDVLRKASTGLHRLALWLDLQADRLETLDELDDEAEAAITMARKLLGDD